MLLAEKIKVFLEDDLQEWEMESKKEDDGYIKTYGIPATFRDEEGNWIGDLIIYFKIIGFGIEGFDGGIDTYFQIPAFCSGKDGDQEFFEEAEAFAFIFSNFGLEIQSLIDEVSDILYNHYEDGAPITSLLEK